MSPDYHIATDDGLITVQARSDITLTDLFDLARNLLAEPDYDPGLPLLVDLRDMRLDLRSEASEPFTRFVIEEFKDRPGTMAVVIDGEMSRELSAATYWLACAVGGTEVFDDYDHALRWLIRKEFAGESDAQQAAGC